MFWCFVIIDANVRYWRFKSRFTRYQNNTAMYYWSLCRSALVCNNMFASLLVDKELHGNILYSAPFVRVSVIFISTFLKQFNKLLNVISETQFYISTFLNSLMEFVCKFFHHYWYSKFLTIFFSYILTFIFIYYSRFYIFGIFDIHTWYFSFSYLIFFKRLFLTFIFKVLQESNLDC